MEELVKRAKAGDEKAMIDLLEKFKFFIYKQGGKYKIPSYDFEDLVQHGYLSVIKAVKLYNPERKSFTTYCNNSVINNFNALLKGEIKHYREVQDENLLDSQVYDFTLEDEVIAYEEAKKLIKALEKLQNKEKELIYAVYMEGMTLKAAASVKKIKYRSAIEMKKNSLAKLRQYFL